MVLDRPRKLKHLALKSIYYQLLNTSCIFTYNRWKYCSCYQFQGCWLQPMCSILLGERNYCCVCRVGVNYDAERIESIIKIADVTYNFHEIKKCIQVCIDFDPECNKFWMYHYQKSRKTRLRHSYWRYLKNYIDDYKICWNNNEKTVFFKNSWFVARYLSF